MLDRQSFWTSGLVGRRRGRSTRPLSRLVTLLVLGAMMATAGPGAAQTTPPLAHDDRDELARQIQAAVRQLHDLRQQSIAHERDHARQQRQLNEQIEQLGRDVAGAKTERDQAQQRVDELQQTLDTFTAQLDQARRQIAAAVDISLPVAAAFDRQLAGAIPSVQQHGQPLGALVEQLQDDHPLTQADALTRWHDWLSQRLGLHRRVELDNRLIDLPQPGVARHAYVLRLGSVNELYLTEDAAATGMAARRPGALWHTDLDQVSRQQIRDIMAIVRQQQPVRLVRSPIMLSQAGDQR